MAAEDIGKAFVQHFYQTLDAGGAAQLATLYVRLLLLVRFVCLCARSTTATDLCCAVNILYRFLTDLDCSKRKSIYTHSHTHPPSIHYPSHP